MSYVLLGILGLAILGSFVATYMSSQTWPIHQVIVMELIFLTSVVFFYLAARTLATHQYYRKQVNDQKQQLAQIESQILPLRGGLNAGGQYVSGEISDLSHRLALITRARGGVYYNVQAESINNDVVTLNMQPVAAAATDPNADPNAVDPNAVDPNAVDPNAQPDAAAGDEGEQEGPGVIHGLVPEMLVFAFDANARSEGGRYLGEFKVVAVPENTTNVELAPALPLDESQRTGLAAAVPGTWTLYTSMPSDNAKVFAEMDDAQRQGLLPASSVAEFAKADRALRDYELFFHEDYVQKSLFRDAIRRTQNNIERTQAAADEATREGKFREAEKGRLAGDLKKFQVEAQAIADYEKSLRQFAANVRARLKATYVENRRAAMTLTEGQLRAQEEIDRRSAAAAQASR